MRGGYLSDGVHVGWIAAVMNEIYRLGAFIDFALNGVRGDVERFWVDVGETHANAARDEGQRRRLKALGCANDLIARPQPQHLRTEVESSRT